MESFSSRELTVGLRVVIRLACDGLHVHHRSWAARGHASRGVGLHAWLPPPSHDRANGTFHLGLEGNHVAAHLLASSLGHSDLRLRPSAIAEGLKVVLQVVLDKVDLTGELQREGQKRI